MTYNKNLCTLEKEKKKEIIIFLAPLRSIPILYAVIFYGSQNEQY